MTQSNRRHLSYPQHSLKFDSFHNHIERLLVLGMLTVILLLMLVSSAFATIHPYVTPSLKAHSLAFEQLVEERQMTSSEEALPSFVKREYSVTQQILDSAEAAYNTHLSAGKEIATSEMHTYLTQSGVNNTLADILIDAIASGQYQASASVINELESMASRTSTNQ